MKASALIGGSGSPPPPLFQKPASQPAPQKLVARTTQHNTHTQREPHATPIRVCVTSSVRPLAVTVSKRETSCRGFERASQCLSLSLSPCVSCSACGVGATLSSATLVGFEGRRALPCPWLVLPRSVFVCVCVCVSARLVFLPLPSFVVARKEIVINCATCTCTRVGFLRAKRLGLFVFFLHPPSNNNTLSWWMGRRGGGGGVPR